jgi:hypothetical protein
MSKPRLPSIWAFATRPLVVQYLGIWAVLAPLAAVAGPFGTFSALGFGSRLLYWGIVIGVSLILALGIRAAIRRYLGPMLGLLLSDLLLILVFAISFSPFLFAFSAYFAARYGSVQVFPLDFQDLALLVFVVCLAVAIVHLVWRPRPNLAEPADGPGESAAAPDRPDLGARLPEDMRGPVLVVSVRDHYVDVFTPKGKSALLMRFSDALRELDPKKGMQIHRSHWVADAHVRALQRDGTRRLVQLACGTVLPISRSFQQAAIARWGDPEPGAHGLPDAAVSNPESR